MTAAARRSSTPQPADARSRTTPAGAPPEGTARPRTRFTLPADLAAAEPPEARGLARDQVRLLAATGRAIEHARFAGLGRFLRAGDLLVVNTSPTRAAAVDGVDPRLGPVVVHFSTRLDDGSWVIELRSAPAAEQPIRTARPGARVRLPGGMAVTLVSSYPTSPPAQRPDVAPPAEKLGSAPPAGGPGPAAPAGRRLWRTQPLPDEAVGRLLGELGRPIRYGYLSQPWPLSAYQTVFASRPDRGSASAELAGSAEMASAGRPFSADLVTRLTSQGVLFAPIELDAGVSSLETAEPPLAERYRVPSRTAMLVNWTKRVGGRVIAVGTTATRALESAAARDGRIRAADGWTELVLGPDRPVRAVDGLLTGLHDPNASHLLLLEAVAGPELVQAAYDAALAERYRWHEFGDSCLLLPG